MDLWGHCDGCRRWFYIAAPPGECPVCQRPPATVIDRDDRDSAASTA